MAAVERIARDLSSMRHDVGQVIDDIRRVRTSEMPRAMRAVEQSNSDWTAALAGVKEHTDRLSAAHVETDAELEQIVKRLGAQERARATWTRKRLAAIAVGAVVATLLYLVTVAGPVLDFALAPIPKVAK